MHPVESKSNQSAEPTNVALTAFLTNYWKFIANDPQYWREHKLADGETLRRKPLYKNARYIGLFASRQTADLLTKQTDLCLLSEQLFNSVHRAVGPFHAARHRYHNKALKALINTENKVEQAIILGAGFDTRSISKQHYPISYFEVDLPQLMAVKSHIYKQYEVNPNAVLIPADYVRDNLITKLQEAGVDFNKATHFIWEGNLMYLQTEIIQEILLKLQSAFTAQVTVSMDFYPAEFIEKRTGDADATRLVENFEAMGAKFAGGIDNLTEFLTALNMEVLDEHNAADLLKEYELDNHPDNRFAFFHLATVRVKKPSAEIENSLRCRL